MEEEENYYYQEAPFFERLKIYVKQRLTAYSVIATSIVICLVLLFGLGGLLILARYWPNKKASFEIQKDLRIPPKKKPHKMQMAKHQEMAPKPKMPKKLLSTKPSPISLPNIPMVEMDMMPMDMSDMMNTDGMGQGGLGGGGGKGAGHSFLGIRPGGNRIIFLFDVSKSVVTKSIKHGIPMEKIREETIDFIKKLSIDSKFTIVQFVRSYKIFTKELVPAHDKNRKKAIEWVKEKWNDSGMMPRNGPGVITIGRRGFDTVLQGIYKLRPNVLFVVSDGSLQRDGPNGGAYENISLLDIKKTIKEQQAKYNIKAKLHFIGFGMNKGNRNEMKALARYTKGKFKEIRK